MLVIQNKLGHWRLVDLNLLDTSLVRERVSHDMNGAWQVRVCYSRKESLVAVHEPELRILVACLILCSRSAVEQFADGAVAARGKDNDLLRLSILVGIFFSHLAVEKLSAALLMRPNLNFAFFFEIAWFCSIRIVFLENLRF